MSHKPTGKKVDYALLNSISKLINSSWDEELEKQINRETASYKRSLALKGGELSEETKAKMSAAHLGLKQAQATKDAISAALKGRSVAIVTCPHCGKTGGNAAMHRWHFDACPENQQNKPAN